MIDTVDGYLAKGCGRCAFFATPRCKVHPWRPALEALRRIVSGCGLAESVKWGVPCYTLGGKNVVLVSAFRDHCAISFFKGALLDDPHGVLRKPGERSQATRTWRFAGLDEVLAREAQVADYVRRAAALEASGARVALRAAPEPVPEELERAFVADPALRAAFAALTPGRQRGYLLHFGQARQVATRERRIAQCTPAILAGRGLHD